jgi:hypothetical protein
VVVRRAILFAAPEAEQVHDADATGQRLRQVAHEAELLRPGKPEASGRVFSIHGHLDAGEQARGVLDLVDDDRTRIPLQEPGGVAARQLDDARVVEADVRPPFARCFLQERCLARS